MKILNTVGLALLLGIFCSCSKTESPKISKTDQTKEVVVAEKLPFTVDSIKVEDSLKISSTLTSGFKSKILIFPSITDKALLDSIYVNTGIRTNNYSKESLLKELDKLKLAQFDSTKVESKDYMPEYKQTWNNVNDMMVVSRDKDFLTLKYTNYKDTGGAHGYEAQTLKVFDLKNNKTVQLQDIASENIDWNKILTTSLKKNVPREQQEMLLVDKIPANNNFYFDDKNLYFVYNQYEIAAYAAGRITIPIPWAELKPYLNPQFKERFGIL